jgi:four helix bundle protein
VKIEKPHETLQVAKQSMDLVTEVYRMTEKYPCKEVYGLTRQIRRAAVSVATDISTTWLDTTYPFTLTRI